MRASIALLAFTLAGCGGSSQPPPVVVVTTQPPPPAAGWTAQFSSMPVNVSGAGFWFDFPQDCPIDPTLGYKPCSANYVVKGWSGPIFEGRTFSMNYTIAASDGAVVFRYDTNPNNTCGPGFPGTVRFYLVSASDSVNGRWFVKNEKATELAPGTFDVSMVLSTDNFTGVYPGTYGATWSSTLANVGGVGVVFGGGCFAGHGVNVSGGTARFTLNSFSVQ